MKPEFSVMPKLKTMFKFQHGEKTLPLYRLSDAVGIVVDGDWREARMLYVVRGERAWPFDAIVCYGNAAEFAGNLNMNLAGAI